jgi:hypothetical protein
VTECLFNSTASSNRSANSSGYSSTISFFEPVLVFAARRGTWHHGVLFTKAVVAIKIIGSPFKSFDQAEATRDAMLKT